MNDDRTPLQKIADEARNHFHQINRGGDGETIWTMKDDRPEWVFDLSHDAHGDMIPDDWRYEFIVNALDAMADEEDPDDIQFEADIYTSDLTKWLGSQNDRYSYCDDACDDYGIEDMGIIQRIQLGQVREKEEVLASVRSSLESRLDELETEENEESEDDSDETDDDSADETE